MKKQSALAVLFLTAGISSAAGPTKIRIFPVFVDVVPIEKKSAPLVYISNEGRHTLTFEAVSAGEVQAVFPPVATIQPGKRQAFRLSVPAVAPGEETKAGAVKFIQISAKDFEEAAKSGAAKTELVVDVPVFANAPDATEKLVRIGRTLRNVGTKQVVISRVGDRNIHARLLPGAEIEVPGGPVFAGEREIEVGGGDEA